MKNISALLGQLQRNLRQNLMAMSSTSTESTSLSARAPTPSLPDKSPPDINDNSLKHASGFSDLAKKAKKQVCSVKPLEIKVSSTDPVTNVAGLLHLPQNYPCEQSKGREKTGAILLSGASGGVVGPSSIYLSIADKLASLNRGIPILRLDYRYPARNKYCVSDVLAAMDHLRNDYAVSRFVLVGWSYGGAPVFTVGGQDDRVVGCGTIASQTAETNGITEVARKGIPVLLMHGTGDRRLDPYCSESLHDRYKKHSSGGQIQLQLFEGDDHSLTKNSLKAEELLCEFIMKQAAEEIEEKERSSVIQQPLLGEQEKVDKMKQGGDAHEERIERLPR